MLKLMGATQAGEMLPSLLSSQLAPCLNTIQPQPISLGASTPAEALSYQGAAQPIIPPLALKSTLTSDPGPLTDLQPLRDQTLNQIYQLYRDHATPAERAYIDIARVNNLTRGLAPWPGVVIRAFKRRIIIGGGIMTERSQSTRVAISMCVLGLNAGCISSQDLSVSDPNDVDPAEPAVATQGVVKPHDIALASDINWDVYSNRSLERTAYLGKAQRVCLNAANPEQCPPGALDYGHPRAPWAAHIDACGGNARWIWAPGIAAASAPAELAEYYFVNHVSVTNRPVAAQVHLAADDQGEVIVNGTAIGSVGSTTDVGPAWASQSQPTAIDIANALVVGTNTITIRAANGSGAFTNCTNCTYQQNPAGVAFCVDIRY